MTRVVWPLLLVAATLLGAAPVPAALFPTPPAADDPFPIQRYRVAEAQLGAALKSLDGGATVRLSRPDFEARVRKASAVAARPVPRLTDATYSATLVGGDLTGTAELGVTNTGVLLFDAFKPAVRSATWADGREAVVGNLGGASGVWVEKADTLQLKWSLAGAPDGAGQRFELRVPPTPVAVLNLELSADQTPTVANDDAMLTGPFPASEGRRGWRLRFGGRGRLEFTVRGSDSPDAGFAEAQLVARYDLTPDQLACSFEYDMQPSRGPVGEWVFALGAGVQVTDVVVNNRAAWRVEPGKSPADRKLRVTLRQPGPGGKIVISAAAPLADAPLPVVRPVNAVVQDERLELRVAPELQPHAWNPGDYRLTNAIVGPDQSRTLILLGALLAPGSEGPFRRAPTLKLADAADSFTTTESAVWRPGRGVSRFNWRVAVRAARGPLFRVALRLPPGYAVERAEPSDVVRYAGPSGSQFVVEFARPLGAGQRAELRFDLRGPGVAVGTVPFPTFSPVGAAQRDGWLSVCPDGAFAAAVRTEPLANEADEFDLLDSPDNALATYTFRATEPGGVLTLAEQSATEVLPPPRAAAKAAPVPEPAAPAVSDLYHVTVVGERGDALAVYGGNVSGRGELPINMPAVAVVRAACVGGQWLDPARCRGDDGILKLPLPASGKAVRFEVRYRVLVSASRVVYCPQPVVHNRGQVRQWWVFAPGLVPSWPLRAESRVASTDLPELLGGPLQHAADGWVMRDDGSDYAAFASRRTVTAVGIGVGLAAFLLGRRRLSLALVLALAASVAMRNGPVAWLVGGGPVLIAMILAIGVNLWRLVREAYAVPSPPPLPTGSKRKAAALVVLLAGGAAVAQAPAPAVVFVVGESVVAPRAVLDRLDAVAKPFAPSAVVTSAAYSGQISEGSPSFVAQFVVHSFQDGEATVPLNLADVRLESATVNGTAALPVAVRPDLYAVSVPGRGRHEIQVKFVAAVTANGQDREVKFGVPEVPATRVSFVAPQAARQVQAVGRAGAQSILPRLDADLGATKAVHLRWRQGAAGAAVVKIREGAVWDAAENAHNLTACYQVKIEQGTVTTLRFEVPAELEPTRVAARPLDTEGTSAILRGWALGQDRNGFRTLRLNLTGPTDGRLFVVLECSHRRSAARQPLFRFPRVHPNGATLEVDGLYGLRTTKLGVAELHADGVTELNQDALSRDRELSAIPDLKIEPGGLAKAFQPTPGKEPFLRPVLVPPSSGQTATVESTWRVGVARAVGEGVVKWAAKEAQPVVEFSLAAKVSDVRGADVASWSQAGDRVQVWLKKPGRTAEIAWVGTLTPAKAGAGVTMDAPTPRLPDGKVTADVMRVVVPDGWAARAERAAGWTALPGRVFTSDGTAPPVRVVAGPK